MSSPRVLLLGGHGKISLLMTPLMLSRSWTVYSVIRDAKQAAEIQSKGENQPGRVEVLIEDIGTVTSVDKAHQVIDKVKPDYVVWSAGAGGKGGAERTYAIDRDAAQHYITAASRSPSIKKFLMVSYIGSRRNRAPWFTDDDWAAVQKINNEVLPDYAKAKVDADECLVARARQRREQGGEGAVFQAIVLRPGTLTDDEGSGKVSLGQTRASGKVSRADVADVAVRLLESEYRGYVDMLAGDESVEEAVARVVRDKVDAFDGEDEEAILGKYKL